MKKIFFLALALAAGSCVPVTQTTDSGEAGDDLVPKDFIYEESIKTVLLYPQGLSRTDVLHAPVIGLDQRQTLTLRFDDLAEQADDYYARIIHCNANWTPSNLNDMEFLVEFNEFSIDDYEYSFNTKAPYVTYNFQMPKVKLPGNYLVAVYRYPDKSDLALTKRFMVADNAVQINLNAGISSGIAERLLNQQITFTINYGDYNISNPHQDLKVVLRKNQRWDNAITDLKPTLIRQDISQLVYDHFNLENNFRGGNEFRYFDLRSVTFLGQNVDRIVEQNGKYHAFLMKDKPRTGQAYGVYNDLNGKYIIENTESGETDLEAEYVAVHFFLEASQPYDFNVFIHGELTNWSLSNNNRLNYDEELGGYTGTLSLKQGWYNYQYYAPEAENPYLIEGSHYETENEYDLIVYYRPIGARADYIIGYKNLTFDY